MGVYTYTDNPLGLAITPRLEEILNKYHSGEEISNDDIGYLIDESARYATIRERIKGGNYKVKDGMLDDEYDLKSVIGDLVDEIDYYYATRINEDKVYMHPLSHFGVLYGKIETLTASQIESEVRLAVREVKELQKTFDDNKDGLKVVGYFSELKKGYKFKMEVTSDTTEEEVIQEIIKQVLPKVEEEQRKKQQAIENLKSLRK